MRKTNYLIPIFVSLCSCISELDVSDTPTSSNPNDFITANSGIRSIDEAIAIANQALSIIDDTPKSRNKPIRLIDNKNGIKVLCTPHSRSSNDTLLYVINFQDSTGYAVVAANKQVEGLIAITESGSYDPNNTPDNPGLAMYMNLAKNYVSTYSTTPPKLSDTIVLKPINPDLLQYREENDTVARWVVRPRVKVNWGQGVPLGLLFNNNTAGCSNTATLMAMSYFEHPVDIALTHLLDHPDSLHLDWTEIKKHTDYHMFAPQTVTGCAAPDSIHHILAHLCLQIGFKSGSDVTKPNLTTTDHERTKRTLRYYGFNVSDDIDYNDHGLPIEDLLYKNSIIFVSGKENKDEVGHIWIMDGCMKYGIKHRLYTLSPKDWFTTGWKLQEETYHETPQYVHFNWGDDGYSNGYFLEGVFNTTSAKFPDDPQKVTSSHDYKVDVCSYVITR